MMPNLRLWLRAEWDRVLGTTLIAVGAVLLVVTYQAVANSRFVADQTAYLASGGLGGLFLLAVGAMLRIQADLHDEWRKLDRIEAALRGDAVANPGAVLADRAAARSAPTPAGAGRGEPVPAGAPAMGLTLGWKADRLRPALVLAAAGLALSLVVAGAGFQHSANSGAADRAFGGLATGVAGVALASLVAGVYTVTLRRRVGGRKVALLAGWLAPEPAAVAASGVVLVGEGLSRFHVEGCPTLASARTTPVSRADVGDRTPCAICGAR
jgi:hypothetical protein